MPVLQLTVTEPAPCRVLGHKQLELGLQGPALHARAVQPLQALHEHFEKERREASVLRDVVLWGQQATRGSTGSEGPALAAQGTWSHGLPTVLTQVPQHIRDHSKYPVARCAICNLSSRGSEEQRLKKHTYPETQTKNCTHINASRSNECGKITECRRQAHCLPFHMSDSLHNEG